MTANPGGPRDRPAPPDRGPARGTAGRSGRRAVGRRQRGAGHPPRWSRTLRLDSIAGGHRGGRRHSGPVAGRMPALPSSDRGASCAARSASCTGPAPSTRHPMPTRRPTRWEATSSTCARWCATPCCSSCPWRRCAGRTAGVCAPPAGPTSTWAVRVCAGRHGPPLGGPGLAAGTGPRGEAGWVDAVGDAVGLLSRVCRRSFGAPDDRERCPVNRGTGGASDDSRRLAGSGPSGDRTTR